MSYITFIAIITIKKLLSYYTRQDLRYSRNNFRVNFYSYGFSIPSRGNTCASLKAKLI